MTEIAIILLWVSSLHGIYHYSRDALHPFFWTNFMFLLYSVSFTYLYVNSVEGANFLRLAGVHTLEEDQLLAAAIICLLGKVAVEAVGPWFRTRFVRPINPSGVRPIPVQLARGIALLFFSAGFAYWAYVMAVLTGGSLNVFQNIGIWEHVIADAGLTILPFHLVFVASHLWFLTYMLSAGSRSSLMCFALYPFAALVSLTTGRLTASILLLLVPIMAFQFIRSGGMPFRKLRGFLLVGGAFIILMYFYRSFTSYLANDRADDFFSSSASMTEMVLSQIVGGGNFPDPQQIILIQDAIEFGRIELQLGFSYLDWAHNLLGLGQTRSTGYLIHGVYFPEKSGAPTPGMIGEALVNFGHFFMLPLVFFGYAAVKLYLIARKSKSYLVRLVYCIFLMNFWAGFIRVDSSIVTGLLWASVPILLLWFGLRLVQSGSR